MNTYRKIANAGFEEESSNTTSSFSKHGLSKRARRVKATRLRAAKKSEARLAFKDF